MAKGCRRFYRRHFLEILPLVRYRCVSELVFEKLVAYQLVQSVLGYPLPDDERWKAVEMLKEIYLGFLPLSEAM